MKFKPHPDFRPQLEVLITGTHRASGYTATLIRFDGSDDTWLVEAQLADPDDPNRVKPLQTWVLQDELQLASDSKELDQEVRRLFGIDPSHCSTCTCFKTD